jgi:hypothetical protein
MRAGSSFRARELENKALLALDLEGLLFSPARNGANGGATLPRLCLRLNLDKRQARQMTAFAAARGSIEQPLKKHEATLFMLAARPNRSALKMALALFLYRSYLKLKGTSVHVPLSS